MLITVEKVCGICGEHNQIVVEKEPYLRWKAGKELIQNVLPDLSDAEREVLISGTHPACWDEAFLPEE